MKDENDGCVEARSGSNSSLPKRCLRTGSSQQRPSTQHPSIRLSYIWPCFPCLCSWTHLLLSWSDAHSYSYSFLVSDVGIIMLYQSIALVILVTHKDRVNTSFISVAVNDMA